MLDEVVEKGLQHADDVEVYYARNTIHSVIRRRGSLKAESIIDQGMGIRVQVDGKIGFAFTTDLNSEKCIEHAVSIARCKKDTINLEFPCSNAPEVAGLYSKETAHLSIEDSLGYLNDLLCINDPNVSLVEGSLEIREMERAVCNSNGLDVSERGTFADLSLAVQGACFVSEDMSSRSFQNLNGDKLLEDLIGRADNPPVKKVGKEIDTIIFSPEAGALLFSTLLCPALCADNVLQKQSFLRGFKGEMVASEKLTIQDDATVPGGLVSRCFDAEGVPSQCVSLIKKGRVTGFLHNLTTAKLVDTESTGNAFRDYRNEPIVFPSNVVVEHEEKMPLKKLIEKTDKGIITKGIIGAYSSDYISGDFSVTLDECSLIENGNMSKIENVTVGGSIFDLLMSIECVSDEKVQSGHFIIPYMKIFWPLL